MCIVSPSTQSVVCPEDAAPSVSRGFPSSSVKMRGDAIPAEGPARILWIRVCGCRNRPVPSCFWQVFVTSGCASSVLVVTLDQMRSHCWKGRSLWRCQGTSSLLGAGSVCPQTCQHLWGQPVLPWPSSSHPNSQSHVGRSASRLPFC